MTGTLPIRVHANEIEIELIQRDAPYSSVFSPNVAKYGPEQLRIRTLCTQCYLKGLKIATHLKMKMV